jgi:hypothetical protein
MRTRRNWMAGSWRWDRYPWIETDPTTRARILDPEIRALLRAYRRGQSDAEPSGWTLLIVLGDEEAADRLWDMQVALERRFPLVCADCRESFVPNHLTYIRCPACRDRRRQALEAAKREAQGVT